jgi:type I restriction enzyme S subunit
MKSDWVTRKISDIANITMGQSPKSEFYTTDNVGMPFLQGNRTFGRRYPVFDTYTTHLTKIAKAGDVIMSVRAPVGDLNVTPVDMCLGRGVCGIRMKNGNQDFLFYLLKYYTPQLVNKESGTVFGSVNRSDIEKLEVDIPKDGVVQKNIARYLTILDEKITNNEAINDNLAA